MRTADLLSPADSEEQIMASSIGVAIAIGMGVFVALVTGFAVVFARQPRS
jgi:hypothetical protein